MKTWNLSALLRENSYPGRGIVLGKSDDGRFAVSAYFIMGRSVNSRNRIFVCEGEDMRTCAFDESKLTDPSLIIYYPVRTLKDTTIVTNGDQTDTVCTYLKEGKSFEDALRTRTFEPDAPIFTPRISGLMEFDGSYSYRLSILKSSDGNPDAPQRFFFEYPAPENGVGHFIHTYACDGAPIPSFSGEPEKIALQGDIDSFTKELWESLNPDNKVSLFVRYIDLKTKQSTTRIVNKNQ